MQQSYADVVEGLSQGGPYSQSQHSQIDSQYNSQRGSTRCKNCDNDTFYEDVNANFICTICSTQVEDYIVESHEEEERKLLSVERSRLKRTTIRIRPDRRKEILKNKREIQSNTLDLLLLLEFLFRY